MLRNFIRDRVNQVVMGYFVSVFAYCLIVLGTIRGTDEVKFVPSTAVLAGLLLALGGVAALIFFIHHIAESLQTGTIVRHIFYEIGKAIADLFLNQLGKCAVCLAPDCCATGHRQRVVRERPVRKAISLIEPRAGNQPVFPTGQSRWFPYSLYTMRVCIRLVLVLLAGAGEVHSQTDTLSSLRELFFKGNTVDSVVVRP